MTFKRNSVPEVKRVNVTSLNSMTIENTNVTDIQVSSTEVPLDNAVNFQVERRETFTNFRPHHLAGSVPFIVQLEHHRLQVLC